MSKTKKKGSRYMNLLTDYAFKRVFGSEQNKGVLINFLNAALNGKEKIIDVEFRDKEVLPFVEDGKRMIFDIYCTTSENSHIIVEIQRTLQPSFSNRALAYCSHSIVKQILKGQRYNFDKVYGIFIMNFHLVDTDPRLIRRISLIDEQSHEIFSDKLHMIFFDLKMMKRKSLNTCKNDIERRLFLIKNMEKMKERPKDYPIYDELFEAADMSYLTNEEVVSYNESKMKLEDDHEGMLHYGQQQLQKGMEKGMEKGMAKGMAKGMEKGEKNMLHKIIQKLKKKGMTLKEVIDALDFPKSEIEMLWE